MQRKSTGGSVCRKAILTMCAVILSASLAFAASPKVSKELQANNSSGQVDVIVQFVHMPTAESHQKILNRGGSVKRELGRFKGAAYTMPAYVVATWPRTLKWPTSRPTAR